MNVIVAVDENWGIGYDGKLLARIPEDMKHFRDKTINKIVVMGRNTFESLPRALSDRVNIVITSNRDYSADSIEICTSIKEVVDLIETKYYPEGYTTDDVFIIGGERVYRDFLPYCKKIYLTYIYEKFDKVDTYFPKLNRDSNWKFHAESLVRSSKKDGIRFVHAVFENLNVKELSFR